MAGVAFSIHRVPRGLGFGVWGLGFGAGKAQSIVLVLVLVVVLVLEILVRRSPFAAAERSHIKVLNP